MPIVMYRKCDVMVNSVPVQCIPHIDSEVLASLVPRVVEILKSGVGLGTKVYFYLIFSFVCMFVYMLFVGSCSSAGCVSSPSQSE